MTYKTLLVHVELGIPNGALLQVTGDLAERFDAGVMGMALCQPAQIAFGDGVVSGEMIEQDRLAIEGEMAAAEAEFRTALDARTRRLEWRSAVTMAPLAETLAAEARCADLLVTGLDQHGSLLESARRLYTSDLVMQAGRPVLLVPRMSERPKLERALVGWKETREARRAIVDALPFLRTAREVWLVEIGAAGDLAAIRQRLEDVTDWLTRHGVRAEPHALPASGDDASMLAGTAEDLEADLVVAGAYGHSRVREWLVGGVTRDLLIHPTRCALLSH